MRLQDRIASSTLPVRVVRDGDPRVYELPSAATLAKAVREAPVRYVLDDSVALLVTHAAFAEPHRLARCLDLVRIPSPCLWIEWSERSRVELMDKLGVGAGVAPERTLGRAGMLIQSDHAGRKGEIHLAWEGEDETPDLAPLAIEFDLDDSTLGRTVDGVQTFGVRIDECDSLDFLLSHARFRLAPEWLDYYRRACPERAAFDAALQANLGIVASDLPYLLAFCLVLASRTALREQESALDKLNVARAKKGKPALLDYLEIRTRLDPGDAGEGVAGGRNEARLHHVSGHFVRRRANVFWRRAHLRGRASVGHIRHRTIKLVVGPN